MPHTFHTTGRADASRVDAALIDEAARLMFDDGIEGYGEARRKACERLGVSPQTPGLPDAAAIDLALQARQRMFWDVETAAEWARRLDAALTVIRFLAPFHPRLVGALTRGIVLPARLIQLHAFAEQPEELIWALSERGIDCEADERRYPSDRQTRSGHRTRARNGVTKAHANVTFPMLRFEGPQDVDVEVTVFLPGREHHAPPSPVDGRPIARLDATAIERLKNAPPLAPTADRP